MSLLAGCQANEEEASNKPGKSSWILDLARDGRSAKLPIYKNDDSDSLVIAHGFSWGPKPLGSLSNITYLKECGDLFRLKPVTLSICGLKVRDILWEIKQLIRAPKTYGNF